MNNPGNQARKRKAAANAAIMQGQMHQFVTFTLNGELFGVDILQAQEIQMPQPITPVPRAPRMVLGLISLRGHVVPLVDLRYKLGMDLSKPIRKPYHIVVTTPDTIAAFLVDEIGDVIDVPSEKFVAPPDSVKAIDKRFLKGVYQLKKGILSILNMDTVLEVS